MEENSGLHKIELLKYLKSFSILVFDASLTIEITMISKGYHYVINLSTVSNFYISIEPVCPGSLPKDLS